LDRARVRDQAAKAPVEADGSRALQGGAQ